MEILIVLGIAGIAVLLVARGPGSGLSVTGGITARTVAPNIGTYPLPPSLNVNPYGGSNTGAYVSTGVNAGANFASGLLAHGAATTAGALSAGITAGVGAAVAIVGQLLAQHQARLKGATNENNAALQVVPVFDSFLGKLVNLVNTRQIDRGAACAALASFDQSVYGQLKSLVGGPGTAWDDAISPASDPQKGHTCNKSCTVGCCIYFGAIGPPLSMVRYVLGDPTGRWGAGDPRLSGKTVTVPKVYPGKYSSYTRALYTVTIN